MARLAALCGLGASLAAASAGLDGLALVQLAPSPEEPETAATSDDAVRLQGERRRICGSVDLMKHQLAVEEYQRKVDAEEERIRALQDARLNRTVANFREARSRILLPFREALKDGLYMVGEAVSPETDTIIKFGLEKMVKPDKPYKNHQSVKVYPALKRLEKQIVDLKQPALSLLWRTLDDFDKHLDAIAKDFPKLQPHLLDSVRLNQTATVNGTPAAVEAYMQSKVLPLILVEAFPSLGKWGPILSALPKSQEESKQYFIDVVDPALPKKCQGKQFMADTALANSSLVERVRAFLSGCVDAVAPGLVRERFELPVRQCRTCEEEYEDSMTNLLRAGSCSSSCAAVIPDCWVPAAISDKCLQTIAPCMRCTRDSIQQLDKCKGEDTNKARVAWLSGVVDSVQSGTIEQKGVDAFLDSFSNAVFKNTPFDPVNLQSARLNMEARRNVPADGAAKAVA